jgi:hypothetical protein
VGDVRELAFHRREFAALVEVVDAGRQQLIAMLHRWLLPAAVTLDAGLGL